MRSQRESWGRGMKALMALVLVLCPIAVAQTNVLSVKATFLYRFTSLVSWPGARPGAPTRLCVAGPERYAQAVSRVVSASASQQPFEVHHIDDRTEVPLCRVLYVVDEAGATRELLRAAAGMPVLTVTDADATPDIRGIIHFTVVDSRVRFHIDDDLAARGGLAIDARLLALALSVRRR